jgi:hypothetical protein
VTRLLLGLAEITLFNAGVLAGRVIAMTPGAGGLCDRLTAHPIDPKYHPLLEQLLGEPITDPTAAAA